MIGKYDDINEALTTLIIGIAAICLAPLTVLLAYS
jgi:hypothetical protein